MELIGAPRQVIRNAQKHLYETSFEYGKTMTAVPREKWPAEFDEGGVPVIGCWRSRSHLATAYAEKPPTVRLTVLRTVIQHDGHWLDGITWDDLQRIKNECGFADRDALEIYPAAADVVNVANLRHLWILPEPSPLAWRKEPRGGNTVNSETATTMKACP